MQGKTRYYNRPSFFWDVTCRIMAAGDWRFGKTYRSHLKGSTTKKSRTACPLKISPLGCTETSAASYKTTSRNIPKERRHQLYRGEKINNKTRVMLFIQRCFLNYIVRNDVWINMINLKWGKWKCLWDSSW